jgi:protein-S-isoprenylcysteine O-methyltransferase Ste14
MHPGLVVMALWVGWLLSWMAAAGWQKRTVKRVAGGAEIRYRLVLIIGGLILAIPARRYEGPLRLYRVGWAEAWTCVGLVAAGIAFAWWARIHLGPLWSGTVTRKEDHRVVDTGPYAIVRHPIYTGLLLSVLATGVIKGTIPGLVGAIIITIGLWMKARLEEQWLRDELGADAYDAYRSRVPMLVPFFPAG